LYREDAGTIGAVFTREGIVPRCPSCGGPVIVVLAGEDKRLICPDCHSRPERPRLIARRLDSAPVPRTGWGGERSSQTKIA
jgi:ribosomal protein S27AE